VLVHPAGAKDRDWDVVESRFRDVTEAFPAATWASAEHRSGPGRQVALASGQAAVALGRLAALRGRDSLAVERWRAVLRDYRECPGVVLAARLDMVGALERLGRYDESLATLSEIAALDPLGDLDAGGVTPDVLAAPLRLARELRARGRDADADAALGRAEGRYAGALRAAGSRDSFAIADALSQVRAARGDAKGSLAALRAAPTWDLPGRALALAARALEAGAPESVFAYSRRAWSTSTTRRVAGQAMLVAAQAWTALDQPDSAIAAYDAVFERWVDPGTLAAPAHFERAELLERMGQWDRARGEFHTLAASYPSHPLAFLSLQRIVQHHLKAGEPELARVAGQGAIANLGHLLETDRDPQVQLRARAVRAELLLSLGMNAEAESALVDLWRRFPEDSLAEDAALRGARLAEHLPGGRERAARLYAQLSVRATSAAVRRAAGEAARQMSATGR